MLFKFIILAVVLAWLSAALPAYSQALFVNMGAAKELVRTLFTLEDVYGPKVYGETGSVYLQVEPNGCDSEELLTILEVWREQAAKLEAGEIARGQHGRWRYCYPEFDTVRQWAKAPSQTVNDALAEIAVPPFEKNSKGGTLLKST
ncbi:MAG: hypothetical protein HDT33_07155 [Clostridiales bacterium]|nr:hypothetical protein [Clostridiales bacterium]